MVRYTLLSAFAFALMLAGALAAIPVLGDLGPPW